MLYSLVYVSTSVDELSKQSLTNLIEKASKRNDSLAVTGLLLYSDGNFMQCLEGPHESIEILMKSIRSDSRHYGHFVLWEGEISNREFIGWGMAARSPDAGLSKMSHYQSIDVWLNSSKDVGASPASDLLEGFWRRVCEHH
jgi:hypothetical protein